MDRKRYRHLCKRLVKFNQIVDSADNHVWAFIVIPLLILCIAAFWHLYERENHRLLLSQARYCLLLDDEIAWLESQLAWTKDTIFANRRRTLDVTKQIEGCPQSSRL